MDILFETYAEKIKIFLQDKYWVNIKSQDARILFLENFQLDTATLVYAINSFEYFYDYINNPFKFNEQIQSNYSHFLEIVTIITDYI